MVQADGYPGYPSAPMAQDEDVIDLREYWNVLMRRRATIFTVAVIAVIAALIATFTTTPIYRASVLLQIEMESSKVVDFGSVAPEGSGSYWDSTEFYQTQYELLQSRSLAKRVIDQLGLRSSETFAAEDEASFIADLKQTLSGWLSRDTPTDASANDAGDPGPGLETRSSAVSRWRR